MIHFVIANRPVASHALQDSGIPEPQKFFAAAPAGGS